ncbi:dTMP kinase [Sphingomonas sp. SUN039]|uniref:dTMP kinase n=1 Tax=Sphingomonas sp. SUN039 TaxID=2937787 RepID=UPI0021649325|nr:dTMP kinase [Sphingomonas sp. SUN039]UVO53500.1 dTMP kinase [Sphingomonas sp. SUN039]
MGGVAVVLRSLTLAGRFITLEGGEGVGKSTQAARLAEALRALGRTVVLTREPGGTPGAEAIRALLMTGEAERWDARAEALLFAAARADHVACVIRPALARGDWVICDRFIDSTRAYQGGAGGVSDADIMALHRVGSEGLLPDRTLLFEFPVELGMERTYGRDLLSPDRMGSRDAAYYADVAARFRRFAEAGEARFRIVDASGSVDEVAARVLAAATDAP